ncbi:MAG TPA: pyridoxamine 5'-phosphate oxidase family protein [Candidatus Saccharimonadales bacterium]|nr:pyridoxamine 5'-phosphate oxidase family protein [Candidatus Saccharimonadales bacterium]
MPTQQEIVNYIKDHPVAVLGTTGKSSRPFGAAIYIYAKSIDQLYFITKTETQKFKNIQENPMVSVTIVDSSDNSSLQLSGDVSVVNDVRIIDQVMREMSKIYANSADWLPPLAKIRAGSYQVISIKLLTARLAHYKGHNAGDKNIFKDLKNEN